MSTQKVGNFRLLRRLGEGAAGEVHLATPLKDLGYAQPGDPLALKLYKPAILEEVNQTNRIQAEFTAGSKLRHPNLVRVYDVDIEPEQPYLIMEYVDGMSLEEWLPHFHPISPLLLLRLATQLTSVLTLLHDNDIEHRDIKPANIMISSNFNLKLMDLGVVRITKDSFQTADTPSHQFLGTIRTSSPEMLYGDDYDKRADLYSLGTIIYSLLHGHEVYEHEKQFARLIQLIKEQDPDFSSAVGKQGVIHSRLLDLCKVLLSRNAANRPQSADEVHEQLEKLKGFLPETSEPEPLHGYMATALTGLKEDARESITFVSSKIAQTAKRFELYVYEPRKATDPLLHVDLDPSAVYLLDRARVATADVVLILANRPSFGVGQEIEIASSLAKPCIILARSCPGRANFLI